jgi:hypothetical protein
MADKQRKGRRMLDSGVMEQADEPDYDFRFGLERILDGIALLVEKEGGR